MVVGPSGRFPRVLQETFETAEVNHFLGLELRKKPLRVPVLHDTGGLRVELDGVALGLPGDDEPFPGGVCAGRPLRIESFRDVPAGVLRIVATMRFDTRYADEFGVAKLINIGL